MTDGGRGHAGEPDPAEHAAGRCRRPRGAWSGSPIACGVTNEWLSFGGRLQAELIDGCDIVAVLHLDGAPAPHAAATPRAGMRARRASPRSSPRCARRPASTTGSRRRRRRGPAGPLRLLRGGAGAALPPQRGAAQPGRRAVAADPARGTPDAATRIRWSGKRACACWLRWTNRRSSGRGTPHRCPDLDLTRRYQNAGPGRAGLADRGSAEGQPPAERSGASVGGQVPSCQEAT